MGRRRSFKRPPAGAHGHGTGGSGPVQTRHTKRTTAETNKLLRERREQVLSRDSLFRTLTFRKKTGAIEKREPKAKGEAGQLRLKKYPKIPAKVNQPAEVSGGNFLVKVKVDLIAVEPPMMRSGYGRDPKRETVVLGTEDGVELLVEYDPLRWPSKSAAKKKKKKGGGGGKIHVQTVDGTAKVGFQGNSFWEFVDLVRRIHANQPLPKQTAFTVTLVRVESQKAAEPQRSLTPEERRRMWDDLDG